MNIGFTGSRHGMTEHQKNMLEAAFENNFDEGLDEFHHGDCEGADEYAHEIAKFYFEHIVVHPSINPMYRAYTISDITPLYDKMYKLCPEKPYLDRNHDIVDAVDLLIAAPETKKEHLRSGTWATIRNARKKGIAVFILEP